MLSTMSQLDFNRWTALTVEALGVDDDDGHVPHALDLHPHRLVRHPDARRVAVHPHAGTRTHTRTHTHSTMVTL